MHFKYCMRLYSHTHIQKTNVRVHAFENAGQAPEYILHIQKKIKVAYIQKEKHMRVPIYQQ